EQSEHPLEECRLAGPGAGDQADDIRAVPMEALPQRAGGDIVFLQNRLANLDQARVLAHVSIPPATISDSRRPSTAPGGGTRAYHYSRRIRHLRGPTAVST